MYYTLNKQALKSNEFVLLTKGISTTGYASVFARFARPNTFDEDANNLATNVNTPNENRESTTSELEDSFAFYNNCSIEDAIIINEEPRLVQTCNIDESAEYEENCVECYKDAEIKNDEKPELQKVCNDIYECIPKDKKNYMMTTNVYIDLSEWYEELNSLINCKNVCDKKSENNCVDQTLKNEDQLSDAKQVEMFTNEENMQNNADIHLNKQKLYNGEEDIIEYDTEDHFYYYKTPDHVTERIVNDACDGIKLDENNPKHKVIIKYLEECNKHKDKNNETDNHKFIKKMNQEDNEERST
ncbi:hypothetical protein COBT_002623, partial [Conglomerata obtusa]